MPQADGWRKGHLCKKYFKVIYVTNKIEFKRKTYKNIYSGNFWETFLQKKGKGCIINHRLELGL